MVGLEEWGWVDNNQIYLLFFLNFPRSAVHQAQLSDSFSQTRLGVMFVSCYQTHNENLELKGWSAKGVVNCWLYGLGLGLHAISPCTVIRYQKNLSSGHLCHSTVSERSLSSKSSPVRYPEWLLAMLSSAKCPTSVANMTLWLDWIKMDVSSSLLSFRHARMCVCVCKNCQNHEIRKVCISFFARPVIKMCFLTLWRRADICPKRCIGVFVDISCNNVTVCVITLRLPH